MTTRYPSPRRLGPCCRVRWRGERARARVLDSKSFGVYQVRAISRSSVRLLFQRPCSGRALRGFFLYSHGMRFGKALGIVVLAIESNKFNLPTGLPTLRGSEHVPNESKCDHGSNSLASATARFTATNASKCACAASRYRPSATFACGKRGTSGPWCGSPAGTARPFPRNAGTRNP